jgi:hypothetical protein
VSGTSYPLQVRDSDHLKPVTCRTSARSHPVDNLAQGSPPKLVVCPGVVVLLAMKTTHVIRSLVAKAIYIRQLTPDIEDEINYELTRQGHISDVDYEALELLMSEMDAGRIRLIASS